MQWRPYQGQHECAPGAAGGGFLSLDGCLRHVGDADGLFNLMVRKTSGATRFCLPVL
jgi:hypothetical protein